MNAYERFIEPYLEQWRLSFLTAIGDIDIYFDDYKVVEFIALFVCAIFNITLLLNLVIAIISQTHAEVTAKQTENMYQERVKQIVTMQSTFLRFYRTQSDPMRLLFTARVINSEEIGRKKKRSLKHVKDELMKFNEKRFESIQDTVDGLDGKIEELTSS